MAFALLMNVPWLARAQSCPTTIPATVTVTLGGAIAFPDGPPETINNVLTNTQNANECTDNPTGLSPLVCSYRTPFTALLAAKILQIVDRTAQGRGLLDTACGNLSGTLTIGEAGSPLVTGSVALQFTPPSSVQATINLTSTLPASYFTGVPGRSTLFEKVAFLAPGRATGTGTFRLELEGESASVPFTTSYQLLGAPTARPEGALLVDTDLTYNCGLSQVTSRLCLSGVAALVPVPRAGLFGMSIGLLALGGFMLARKRTRSSAG
jgi:hypothetical protein